MSEPLAWAVYPAEDEDRLRDDDDMSVDYVVFPDEDEARDWARRTFEEDPKRPVVALYDSAALAAELERVKAERDAARQLLRMRGEECVRLADMLKDCGEEMVRRSAIGPAAQPEAELAFEKAQTAKTVHALNLDMAEKEAERVGLLKLMEEVAFELEAASVEGDLAATAAAQAKRLRKSIHAALGPAGEAISCTRCGAKLNQSEYPGGSPARCEHCHDVPDEPKPCDYDGGWVLGDLDEAETEERRRLATPHPPGAAAEAREP